MDRQLSTFVYRSVIDAPAVELFRWYEQPGALEALSPPALVRIEGHEGGIRNGGTATLSIGIGPARVRWVARHYGYIAGRQFCDEQLRGPFAVWRHTHRFEPISRSQTMHEDRIEFAAFRHSLLSRLAAVVLTPLLTRAFAQRHRILQARVGRARVKGGRSAATAALAPPPAAPAAVLTANGGSQGR